MQKTLRKIGLAEFYEYYRDNNFGEDKKSLFYVDPSEFGRVIKRFNELVSAEMIYEGKTFRMPFRMGKIFIRKTKKKISVKNNKIVANLPVNWKETKQLWENKPEAKERKILIYYMNKHTDGYVMKVYYEKRTANYKNKSYYRFTFQRDNNREIKKAVESGVDYLIKEQ